ncbi:CesT family type III secretion system chaperone [Vibrio sp. AND4]|uniref:CesT family type III secretion system chaperone n=1 Tax=Vibrio sp. AND4 TaxID=314289 RepID=UPI00015F0EF4|nr:CesT family type III secretion system chaperone [Vibrio sp. AND4]EDP58963.1 type III secretion protein [Vibrio sp. AND4]
MSLSKEFLSVIERLHLLLSIKKPLKVDEVVSFLLDGQEISITEYPLGKLLMFANLPKEFSPTEESFSQQNMFSQIAMKPVLGKSEKTQSWILWNRIDINNADSISIEEQLTFISETLDQIWLRESEIPNDIQISKSDKYLKV